jgi:hypothetical protein
MFHAFPWALILFALALSFSSFPLGRHLLQAGLDLTPASLAFGPCQQELNRHLSNSYNNTQAS